MCDLCRSGEPSVHVTLHHNVGMLFMRQVHTTDARVCAACLARAFRKHQLSNLFLGWWGTISLFMTFYYLVDNTTMFRAARKDLARMAARRAETRPDVSGPPRERLQPFQHNVRLRLRGGESADAVAADLARVHAVPLTEAQAFVRDVALQENAVSAAV